MEPFVIQCTTCRARLKVHDPSVVGQIVECPKCQSFVAVTAPPNSDPASKSAIGSAISVTTNRVASPGPSAAPGAGAARPATPGAPAARKATPPPLPKKAGGSSLGIPSSSLSGVAPGQPGARAASRAAGPWAPTGDRAATGQPELAGAADEDRARQSAASAALAFAGQHRWWIVGSAAGMLAAASVAWMAGRASHSIAAPDPTPIVEPTIPAVSEHPGDDSGKEQLPTRAAKSSSSPPPTPASLAAAAEPSVDENQTAGDVLADAPAKTASSPTSKSPAKAPQDSPATTGAAAVDPPAPAEPATKPSARPEAATAPDGLPPAVVAATPALDEDMEPAVPFDPAKQAELMSHLQDKLPALDFPGVPLGQFVSFLSLASTVPMTIDHDSLAAVGKSAKTRITVKLDDATVEQALKAALEKAGLAFHIEPGRLVISARSAKSK